MIIGLIGGGIEGLPEGLRYPSLAQGKDTVADYLAARGFVRVAFGDNIKKEIATAFGTTQERLDHRALKETPQDYLALQNCSNREYVELCLSLLGLPAEAGCHEVNDALSAPRSPRWIAQMWGTEYRRKMYGDDYWLKQGLAQVSGPGNYVVTDIRLPNEGVTGTENGFCMTRLYRPGTEVAYTGNEHESEISLLTFPTDFTLVNRNGDFDGLYRQVDDMLEQWLKKAA